MLDMSVMTRAQISIAHNYSLHVKRVLTLSNESEKSPCSAQYAVAACGCRASHRRKTEIPAHTEAGLIPRALTLSALRPDGVSQIETTILNMRECVDGLFLHAGKGEESEHL